MLTEIKRCQADQSVYMESVHGTKLREKQEVFSIQIRAMDV